MSAKDIRNIVLLGHSGSGKTTLAESMLYLTGGTDRLGRIADGNTVCDYDPEEIRRQISISLAVAPVEYDSCKINVLDVPGGFDFAGEVAEAVQAADAAVIVCSAKAGMSVGAEKAWKYCEKNSLPRLLYISKTDEENSDYNAAFNTLRERFGKNIAPVVAPIWDESKKVIGIIDVLHKRAFEFGPGGGRVEIEVPENKKPVLDELYDALKESVAETSEEFMEKFFAGEDFTYAEMIHGLRQGVKDDSTTYFENPVDAAVKWCDEGAMFLHVVDLDGAFSGKLTNASIIGDICEAVDIPVEVGGGIRSEEAIETYLEAGVNRVIIGSKAVEDPEFITAMSKKYGSSLAVSIDAKGDVVATRGWVDGSDKKVLPFAQSMLDIGINTLVYTDISRDGMLTGPNFEMLSQLQQLPFIRLIASGGMSSIADLKKLQAMGVYGAITGKALYEGKITMAEIRALGGM